MLLKTNKEDIEITGQPILDRAYNFVSLNTTKINKKNEFIVLWCHQNHTIDENEVLLLIKNWLSLSSIKNLKLIVKFHPDANPNDIIKIKTEFIETKVSIEYIENNTDILKLIQMSDILIAQESTTMLEAFVLSKYSISLDPIGIRKEIPYVASGISLSAKNEFDLEKNIFKIISNEVSSFII